ncbi:amino acid adenylation domain-containing protein [Nocardia tenerifensis]|uniref:Amino acid adenylation domain-containing protein n=1 Tax=Nocardia tenerifensis TaxID=228006 RepID=A0A318KHR9_9NOCA|nr:amino acid adenylation domain-containing protein [Nocardia tenerifensis]
MRAVLGVLAAGACYVPIGVDQPPWRRASMHDVAGVRLTIGEEPEESSSFSHRVTPAQCRAAAPLTRPRLVDSSSLAYIIFTSGTTGQPKGVQISHRSAVNTLEDINERWRVGPRDRCLNVSALDFDLSVYEIFGPLMAGGAVVVPGTDGARDAQTWLRLMHDSHVTVWDSVPVLLDALITAAEGGGDLGGLRLVITGGDWVGTDLPRRLHALAPDCVFVACGGGTEASIYSNYCQVDEVDPAWVSVPYGFPLGNQRYRVVDRGGRDCPDWVSGELWIGGVGVARGYRNDPQRTAERFVEYDGQRWYRTGDIGRYRPGGMLEFQGRNDFQVKLNGYRIELGEIEAAVESHEQVRRAVAAVTGSGLGRRLIAYVQADSSADVSAIAEHAATRLPEYARPARILVLPEFPLSANGKIDRKALSDLGAPPIERAPVEEPHTEVERALAEEWRRVLRTEVHSRHDRFVDLGGDSLSAMRLSTAVHKRFGRKVSLRALFRAGTVAAMAELLLTKDSSINESGDHHV